MDVKEVQNYVRSRLTKQGGFPPGKKFKKHVFARKVIKNTTLPSVSFDIAINDVLRFHNSGLENCVFFLFDRIDFEPWSFFVIPSAKVVPYLRDVFVSSPKSAKQHSDVILAFDVAGQKPTLSTGIRCSSATSGLLNISAFRNDCLQFSKHVFEYFDLLGEEDNWEVPKKICERCGEKQMPDYGTDVHDRQCVNKICRMVWCGDYWADETSENSLSKRRRAYRGWPHDKGWWVYDPTTHRWMRWKGEGLDG